MARAVGLGRWGACGTCPDNKVWRLLALSSKLGVPNVLVELKDSISDQECYIAK